MPFFFMYRWKALSEQARKTTTTTTTKTMHDARQEIEV
jgi:hypothetical protein